MLRIKRLYLFILQTFLPLFMMTFFICLFILLMQFLWMRVNDLVGKGLGIDVIAELFFYAALSFVPMALPLAILLASLMVFGNLGERFELTAIKASGVSLLRIMMPLIIFISAIAIGAFFFQNNVLPKAQVKMWTLVASMKQKSPELEIPEGAFYNQIDGYNLFVQKKNPHTGMLYNMKIYDVSQGFGTANIISADSGKLSISEDKMHLLLNLYSGESFEDLKDSRSTSSERGGMLYRRESFGTKTILIPFDANFNRMDESFMQSQYIGKNMKELIATMDSVSNRIDSIGSTYGSDLKRTAYFNVQRYNDTYDNGVHVETPNPEITLKEPLDVDSLFNSGNFSEQRKILSLAISKASRFVQEYEFRAMNTKAERKTIIYHDVELQKKFTLSFACLVFFFIGAPLGSIIRKGGLAIPVVISVLFFVIYYVIDISSQKLAKEAVWPVWQGMWLSSGVLLPIGIFFTYKAINDSAVFNADAYRNFFRKLIGAHTTRKIELKEMVMDDMVVAQAHDMLNALMVTTSSFERDYSKRLSYLEYWRQGIPAERILAMRSQLEATVEYMSNSHDVLVVHKLMDFPIIRNLILYHPIPYRRVGNMAAALFPISIPLYLLGLRLQKSLIKEIATVAKVSGELQAILNNDKADKQA